MLAKDDDDGDGDTASTAAADDDNDEIGVKISRLNNKSRNHHF